MYMVHLIVSAYLILVFAELIRIGLLLVTNLRSQETLPLDTPMVKSQAPPKVSVIMPAMNEEDFVQASALSVIGSDYPDLELILVNDRSSDRTGEIINELANRYENIQALTITGLPSGWTGKTHAMFQASNKANGAILLFMDADTLISVDAISRSVEKLLKDDIGMLSLLPGFTEMGFLEKAVHPHLALGIAYFNPLNKVNDSKSSCALASGSYLMLTKQAYIKLGTWKKFRKELTEDVAMSKSAKKAGIGLKVIRGGQVARTRPFGSLAQIHAFWKRTFYGAFERSPLKLLRLSMNYITLDLLCFFLLFSGIALVLSQATVPVKIIFLLSLLDLIIVLAPFSLFLKQDSISWVYGLALPVASIICSWITISAFLSALCNTGIKWRDSRYR